MSREVEIEIPGFTLAARVWGEPEGRPVLGVHGWLDNAATFDRLAPHLEGLRLVAIDFPGHGRSGHRPEGMSYHFVDLVPVMLDAADALGWERFSILGHSMGAAAATLVAGTEPERIERLALIDGLGPWTRTASEAPQQLAEGLRERRVLMEKTNRVFSSREEAARIIGGLYKMKPKYVEPLVERGLVEDEEGWRFSYDLMLRGTSLIRFTEQQVLAFLTRIACPTMLVRPRSGWPVEQDEIEQRLDVIDDMRIAKVDGGHHVHLEKPERVEGLVGPFLNGAA